MSWLDGFEHFVRADEPLAPRCWLRIGGPAEYFAQPTTYSELEQLVQRCRDQDLPLRLLGGGSNILVRDAGVKGVTIRLDAPEFGQIRVEDDVIVAASGADLFHVISVAVREGLAGLEQLVGIPGTLGGALHGNAGNRATDVGAAVQSVTVLTRSGDRLVRNRNEMNFAYRSSSLDELAILSAKFRLERESRQELTRRMQQLWIVKRSQQPQGDQSAGCLFKDPLGTTASELIEQSGLKGSSFGGASLFDRDLNFVTLTPDASSEDVLRLMEQIREQVSQQLGVDLENAIQIW